MTRSLLKSLIRRLRNKHRRLVQFEAILEEWPNSGQTPDPFDTPSWLDSAEAYLGQLRESETKDRLPIEHYIVPVCMLAAAVAAEKSDVRILDFGGGVGVNYTNVRAALASDVPMQYDIVDSASNYRRWRRQFGDHPDCRYFTDVPQASYDLVFASSTLQYVADWRAVVVRLCGCDARWIVLPRLPVTSGREFVARQNVRFLSGPHAGRSAGATPHRFFNRSELLVAFSSHDYGLVHDHFISDFAGYLTGLAQPPGDVTLRVMSFASVRPTNIQQVA